MGLNQQIGVSEGADENSSWISQLNIAKRQFEKDIVRQNAHLMPEKFYELFPGESLPGTNDPLDPINTNSSLVPSREANIIISQTTVDSSIYENGKVHTPCNESLDFRAPMASMQPPKLVLSPQATSISLTKLSIGGSSPDVQSMTDKIDSAITFSPNSSVADMISKRIPSTPVEADFEPTGTYEQVLEEGEMSPSSNTTVTNFPTPKPTPKSIESAAESNFVNTVNSAKRNASPLANFSTLPTKRPKTSDDRNIKVKSPVDTNGTVKPKTPNVTAPSTMSISSGLSLPSCPAGPSRPLGSARPSGPLIQSDPSAPSTLSASTASHAPAFTPPNWYINKSREQIYRRFKVNPKSRKRNVEAFLTSLREAIEKPDVDRVRNYLQQARFNEGIGEDELFLTRMFNIKCGLPYMFLPSSPGFKKFPYDVRADAKELYIKWESGDFNVDILRGIDMRSKQHCRNADRLIKDFEHRLPAQFYGEGHLVNGQWWPTQLCTMRDGAHGSAQHGIAGKNYKGAFSVVISGGGHYDDWDNGDEVYYRGTDGKDGEATNNTEHLIHSKRMELPVRVLRGQGLAKNNPYRPSVGLRYDGVYDVKGYEVVDIEKQIHKFHLVRQPGQDPIRCAGVAARPTALEVDRYKLVRKMIAGID